MLGAPHRRQATMRRRQATVALVVRYPREPDVVEALAIRQRAAATGGASAAVRSAAHRARDRDILVPGRQFSNEPSNETRQRPLR